jgi:cytochrome P450
MCWTCRFCFGDLDVWRVGIVPSLELSATRTHARGVVEIARPHGAIAIEGVQCVSTQGFPHKALGKGLWHLRGAALRGAWGTARIGLDPRSHPPPAPAASGVCSRSMSDTLPREIPGPTSPNPIESLLALRALMTDWRGFFGRLREHHGSTVFRVDLGGLGIAVTDRAGIWGLWNGPSVQSPYGFGPRRPWPSAIADTVPMVFSNDDAHARRKRFVRALVMRAAPRMEETFDAVFARHAARWLTTKNFDWGAELDAMVAEFLFTWIVGASPPGEMLVWFEANLAPVRLLPLPLPGDLRVRWEFDSIVSLIRKAPRFAEAAALIQEMSGFDEEAAARELAFTLSFNGFGALSGAVTSTLAELSRNPLVLDAVREEIRAAYVGDKPPPIGALMGLRRTRHAVQEAVRLHQPAPIIFREAREDFTLASSTGAYAVKRGELIWGVIELANRDPQLFTNPEVYDPSRFEDPATQGKLVWADGPPAPTPAENNRQCAGRDESALFLQLLLTRLLPRYRWALTSRPAWGADLMPRNLPAAPLKVAAFFPDRLGGDWSAAAEERPASFFDKVKMDVVSAVRGLEHEAVDHWSHATFRQHLAAVGEDPPAVVPARQLYGAGDLPAFLSVPDPLPACGRMGLAYVVPYYATAAATFAMYHLDPITPEAAWTPEHPINTLSPDSEEGWGNLQDDDTFARLRVHGPNPFLLEPAAEADVWYADYGPYFEGIAPPVRCAFGLGPAGFEVTAIRVDDDTHRPGDAGWPRARRLANALDARLTIVGQHLLRTHLVFGQAFALARFTLADDHPLRSFCDLHSYATLQVNDFAYKLLISPESYFILSGFIARDQGLKLFENAYRLTSVEQLITPRDVARRRLDRIPDNPYAADALEAWAVLEAYARGFVERIYASDDAVAGDPHAQVWHAQLKSLLPEVPADLATLATRADLTLWLTCQLSAVVMHQVVGDYSPYCGGNDREQMSLLNLDRVLDGLEEGPIALNDVFLMKQGAYAGKFNPTGNGMLGVPVDERTEDPVLREANRAFDEALRALQARVEARNQGRKLPLLRMLPRMWELSIGF